MDNTIQSSKRIAYFDILRVLATLAIMIIHCDPYKYQEHTSLTWFFRTLFICTARWGVPIFIMISGALFLGSRSTIKKLYTHNILRIVTALLFWSAVYAVLSEILHHYGFINVVLEFFYGHYHMWFLFMILGLYIMVPLLRKIVETKELMIYFLLIAFVFNVLIPQSISFISLGSTQLSNIVDTVTSKVYLDFSAMFLFVLGYFLHNTPISSKKRKIIYVVGVVSFVFAVGGTIFASWIKNASSEMMQMPQSICSIGVSCAVFVFAKYNFSFHGMSSKMINAILKLSKISFGAYLVHAMIIELLYYIFGAQAFQVGCLSVPMMFIIICPLAFLISALLNRIPLLNKYIT